MDRQTVLDVYHAAGRLAAAVGCFGDGAPTMKPYVWSNPYRVKFGGSLLMAVAFSEDEARQEAQRAAVYRWGFHVGQASALELGQPDRVVDLPCAEVHEWCE